MAWREVNPGELEGEALRRWYRRSPEDIERERQAAADARYKAFFAQEHPAGAPSLSRPAGKPSQDGRGASISPGRGRPDGTRPPPPSLAPRLKGEWGQPAPLPSIPLPANGLRPVPLSPTSPNDTPSGVGFSTAAPSARSMSYLPEQQAASKGSNREASAPQPKRHGIWIAGRQPGELDPSQTEVFRRGPDGKLHAVPGWRTTDPFEFSEWSRMFDWGGVAGDLADITTGALDFMAGGGLTGEIVKNLGYKIGPDIVRGIVHGHHSWPKFMGGPSKQDLARLHQSLHTMFHRDLATELKAAGFPHVGGRGGGTRNWAEYFAKNPEKQDEAMAILQRVSREFDRKNGTKVSKYLDGGLAKGKPSASPPFP